MLARSGAADDVLVKVEDRAFRLAQVHLTRQRETDPHWPRTTAFHDLAEWRANVPEWL